MSDLTRTASRGQLRLAPGRRFLPLEANRAIRGRADLDAKAKLVAFVLTTYADEGGVCWPSIATLARDTGLSEASVKRALVDLRRVGLLVSDPPSGPRMGNLYLLAGLLVAALGGGHREPRREPEGVQARRTMGLRVSHDLINSTDQKEEAPAPAVVRAKRLGPESVPAEAVAAFVAELAAPRRPAPTERPPAEGEPPPSGVYPRASAGSG